MNLLTVSLLSGDFIQTRLWLGGIPLQPPISSNDHSSQQVGQSRRQQRYCPTVGAVLLFSPNDAQAKRTVGLRSPDAPEQQKLPVSQCMGAIQNWSSQACLGETGVTTKTRGANMGLPGWREYDSYWSSQSPLDKQSPWNVSMCVCVV